MKSEVQAGGLLEAFEAVAARLRSECPWDSVQTFESLRGCLADEVTEAIAAVQILNESGSGSNLCEELGDMLLLIVLYSKIAEEQGMFSLADVIRGITEKMIRRHPAVFGTDQAMEGLSDAERWAAIKREEKKDRTPGQEQLEQKALREAAGFIRERLSEYKFLDKHGRTLYK